MKKCGVPSGQIQIIAERYHTYSLFTFPYYLNKKSPLSQNSRTTKLTWYHLVSHPSSCHCEPVRRLVNLHQGLGASTRFNGRTRDSLPIDSPAPRPCSANPACPLAPPGNSLKGIACLLFSSQLLSTIHGHYSPKVVHLSTVKFQFAAPNKPSPGEKVPPKGGGRGTAKSKVQEEVSEDAQSKIPARIPLQSATLTASPRGKPFITSPWSTTTPQPPR